MLISRRLNWLQMLFVLEGSVLPRILPQLGITALMAAGAVLASRLHWPWCLGFTPAPFGYLGVSLAIFMGFRNSASYDRWVEARKIWGALVIQTRSLARQAVALLDSPERARRVVHLTLAFTHALKHQVRESDPRAALAPWVEAELLEDILATRFRPAAILVAIDREFQAARRAGEIEAVLIPAVEVSLGALSDVLAASERIANTPIPFTYSIIIHRTVFLFCFMVPFGLAQAVGLLTPLITVVVAYPFLALEALAQELENPFGEDPNALPLNAISETVEQSLRETLGERGLSPREQAHEYRID